MKNDYKGKVTIGFIDKGEIIYPIRIIDNWVMFINNTKYVWIKIYDDKTHYAINIEKYSIDTMSSTNFHNKDFSSYLKGII